MLRKWRFSLLPVSANALLCVVVSVIVVVVDFNRVNFTRLDRDSAIHCVSDLLFRLSGKAILQEKVSDVIADQ